jgi:hypothetical protein
VAVIEGLTEVLKESECKLHELGGSQGESPGVGCSKLQSCEIARIKENRWIQVAEDRWIRVLSCLSHIQRFGG